MACGSRALGVRAAAGVHDAGAFAAALRVGKRLHVVVGWVWAAGDGCCERVAGRVCAVAQLGLVEASRDVAGRFAYAFAFQRKFLAIKVCSRDAAVSGACRMEWGGFAGWGLWFHVVFVTLAVLSNVLCFARFYRFCEDWPLKLRLSAAPGALEQSLVASGSSCVDTEAEGAVTRIFILILYGLFFGVQMWALVTMPAVSGGDEYTEKVLRRVDYFLYLAKLHFLFDLGSSALTLAAGNWLEYETLFVYHRWLESQPLGQLQRSVDALLMAFAIGYFALRVARQERLKLDRRLSP